MYGRAMKHARALIAAVALSLAGALGGAAAPASAAITPVVTEFSTGIGQGAAPDGITNGPDGNIWFAEPGLSKVGRITPAA